MDGCAHTVWRIPSWGLRYHSVVGPVSGSMLRHFSVMGAPGPDRCSALQLGVQDQAAAAREVHAKPEGHEQVGKAGLREPGDGLHLADRIGLVGTAR